MRHFNLLVLCVLIATIACGGSDAFNGSNANLIVTVSETGQLQLEAGVGLSTPTLIEVTQALATDDPATLYGVASILIVRFNEMNHVYDLQGQEFQVRVDTLLPQQPEITYRYMNNAILIVITQDCPESQLRVNDRGEIATALTLRDGPGMAYTELEWMNPGSQFTVLEGPICDSERPWWKIQSDQYGTGWAAESNSTQRFMSTIP